MIDEDGTFISFNPDDFDDDELEDILSPEINLVRKNPDKFFCYFVIIPFGIDYLFTITLMAYRDGYDQQFILRYYQVHWDELSEYLSIPVMEYIEQDIEFNDWRSAYNKGVLMDADFERMLLSLSDAISDFLTESFLMVGKDTGFVLIPENFIEFSTESSKMSTEWRENIANQLKKLIGKICKEKKYNIKYVDISEEEYLEVNNDRMSEYV